MIEVKTLCSLFTVPMSLCCDPQETGIVNELGFDSNCKNYPYIKRGTTIILLKKKRKNKEEVVHNLQDA